MLESVVGNTSNRRRARRHAGCRRGRPHYAERRIINAALVMPRMPQAIQTAAGLRSKMNVPPKRIHAGFGRARMLSRNEYTERIYHAETRRRGERPLRVSASPRLRVKTAYANSKRTRSLRWPRIA